MTITCDLVSELIWVERNNLFSLPPPGSVPVCSWKVFRGVYTDWRNWAWATEEAITCVGGNSWPGLHVLIWLSSSGANSEPWCLYSLALLLVFFPDCIAVWQLSEKIRLGLSPIEMSEPQPCIVAFFLKHQTSQQSTGVLLMIQRKNAYSLPL